MAAEALIVEDAYQKGYADAMEDMRKKKEQRRQREQEKKARRWYFIKQKAYGLVMLAVTVLAVWATEGDIRLAASSAADRAVFITFRRAYKRAGNSNHALEATQEREAKNENNKHFELKGRRSQDLYSGKHGV